MTRHYFSRHVCALILVPIFGVIADAQWFVDIDNASGTEDGTAWESAYTTIQPALDAAFSGGGGQVWVAAGTYGEERVSAGEENTGSLFVPIDVSLFGGFDGSEEQLGERDHMANETTIAGGSALGGRAAVHVVTMGSDSVIDGFTITRTIADSADEDLVRVAVYAPDPGYEIRNLIVRDISAQATATAIAGGTGLIESCLVTGNSGLRSFAVGIGDAGIVRNCIIRDNDTGGASVSGNAVVESTTFERNRHSGQSLYSYGGAFLRDEAMIVNCTFIENEGEDAGAIQVGTQFSPSDVTIMGCTFIGNRSLGSGGAISIERSKMTISNSLFIANSAADVGGAIFGAGVRAIGAGGETDTIAVVTNSTFFGNTAVNGGDALSGSGFDIVSQNSIFWNNCP